MNTLKNQHCPFCKKNTITLTETKYNIPYFGNCFLMSMSCSNCNYHITDIESEERKEPSRYTITINNKEDLKIRVIKSSQATIKIPQLKLSVTPGPASTGYISNIEGVLLKFKKIIQEQKELAEDEKTKKHAKNLLKKLWKVELGELPLAIMIEDPSGNSAIISKNTKMEKIE